MLTGFFFREIPPRRYSFSFFFPFVNLKVRVSYDYD